MKTTLNTRRKSRLLRRMRPTFRAGNLYLLLLITASVTLLGKGIAYAGDTEGGNGLMSLLCILMFCVTALLFRIAWKRDRFESHFE